MRTIFAALLALVAMFNPALAAEEAPLSVDGATTISIDEGATLFDEGVLFVDVRKASDWDAGRVPGSVNLYANEALTEDALMAEAGKDEKVVFYCNGQKCGLSAKSCAKAVSWGYTQVYYLRDGFPGWEQAGLPVE